MSSKPNENTGDLKTAVKIAMELLSKDRSQLAREQAEEILRHYPDEVNSLFVVAVAIGDQGDSDEALDRLQALVKRAPDFALAQQELGFVYADKGQLNEAIEALQRAVAIEPKLPASWKLMGELYLADEDEKSAAEAMNQYLLTSSEEPDLIRAVNLFKAGKIPQAERLCRRFLYENPTNVTAINLLADIAIELGVLDDAENLLERCLELAPDFHMARLNYTHVLSKREKLQQALAQVDHMLEVEPRKKFTLLITRAAIFVKMGDFERALSCYEYLLSNYPPREKITLSYAHALKTVGQQKKAIAAYRQTIDLKPSFGDAYWSLANLKTFRFKDADIEAMRVEIDKSTCTLEDHFHLCFALGKALGDRQQYEESFLYYQRGNNIKKKHERYDAEKNESATRKIKMVCSSDLFSAAKGQGCKAPDPIFIVGLPRSGSTLLEQILASHSQVDGTKELIEILSIVRRLGAKKKKTDLSRYPELLADLNASQLDELGQEYIDRTRIQRGEAPFFIDKMPNNFLHVGFISLVLPNAKIIDARRHPMATCFSGYTQLFASGQRFTYGLSNIGRYYRDYVEVMDHWDEVLPGKVLRVQYEDVVSDTEAQVRRMLDYCELPFEENCLQFHQTERAVRTASSEQVRQPIYSAGLEHWRNYEPHLDKLKDSLAGVLERYPI
ncbi:MAG: sulfotransferase [Proteobacteria bacterium]|nr:sulfotransferase [Pseudomonadota bacterium]